MTATDWYSRNYPDSPLNDGQRRCLRLLEDWRPLYNIYRVGRTRPDGGFRPCGTGIKVVLSPHTHRFATFDTAELTILVLLAHQHRCRVELGPGRGFGTMEIIVHPRAAGDTGHSWEWHPGLDDLARRATPVPA